MTLSIIQILGTKILDTQVVLGSQNHGVPFGAVFEAAYAAALALSRSLAQELTLREVANTICTDWTCLRPSASTYIFHLCSLAERGGPAETKPGLDLERIRTLPGRKILLASFLPETAIYDSYYDVISQAVKKDIQRIRQNLETLAPVFDLAVAESHQVQEELQALGYRSVVCFPFTLLPQGSPGGSKLGDDWSKIEAEPVLKELLSDPIRNILVFGPFCPTQRLEDAIRLFSYYRKRIEPASRLVLMGPVVAPEYLGLLKSLSQDLCGKGGVLFGADFSQEERKSCYETADLFLSLAQSEGLNSGFLDAVDFGVPVLTFAHAAAHTGAHAAAREFWGTAGVYATERDLPVLAELVDILLKDSKARDAIVTRQRERVDELRVGLNPAELVQRLLA